MASVFQNPQKTQTDLEVYRNELRLADLAEPLGFQSIWGVEHHFTDYTMCPDVLQFLTYMAGRTARAQLGSMVVACCRGTTRCAWPRKCPCSTISRAGG
jgi:alkanesulfonate monooxygenase SsuD/methylene tetrahydromethanopterin reductase-like flavin-dependent oxidoreductase (luciferase family)